MHMGFFNFFSKNKEQQKETLDKGLEKTKESFFGKLTRAERLELKKYNPILKRMTVHKEIK